MIYPGMTVYMLDEESAEAAAALLEVIEPKHPEVPPEVWQTVPVDGDRAMQAVRAMCGG